MLRALSSGCACMFDRGPCSRDESVRASPGGSPHASEGPSPAQCQRTAPPLHPVIDAPQVWAL